VTEDLVLDASAMVTLLIGGQAAGPIATRLRGCAIHVPAHFDAEVLSALGRLSRAGELSGRGVTRRLELLAAAPFERHAIAPLLAPAWRLRTRARLVDALYIALAQELSVLIVTLDRGLASAAPRAELLVPEA
jgi:predicted nucleic acid-binding protein